jgi:hypothetical protein
MMAYQHRQGKMVIRNDTVIPIDPYEGVHHQYVKEMGFS